MYRTSCLSGLIMGQNIHLDEWLELIRGSIELDGNSLKQKFQLLFFFLHF